MAEDVIRERTLEEKVDYLIEQFALLTSRVALLERHASIPTEAPHQAEGGTWREVGD